MQLLSVFKYIAKFHKT